MRGLGTPHSSCSGFRAGLGTPPQARPLAPLPPQPPLPPPPRSLQQLPLRAPGQLPVRRRDRQAQGADGNESSGALRRQQRPMERGGSTGDPRQRPLAVTRRHAARREGSGRGAAERRSGVSGVGRWGGGSAPTPPQQPLAVCLFPKQVPPNLHTAFPLCTATRTLQEPTSFPDPPHTLRAPHHPGALPPTSPPNHPHPSSLGCKATASAKPFSVPSH